MFVLSIALICGGLLAAAHFNALDFFTHKPDKED